MPGTRVNCFGASHQRAGSEFALLRTSSPSTVMFTSPARNAPNRIASSSVKWIVPDQVTVNGPGGRRGCGLELPQVKDGFESILRNGRFSEVPVKVLYSAISPGAASSPLARAKV